MIEKITVDNYLKRFDNMSLSERQSYLAQVKEWNKTQAPILSRRMNDDDMAWQSVMQCWVAWNAAEQEAFRKGVILLTPFANKPDSWLPEMVYIKAVSRVIKRMVRQLSALNEPVVQKSPNSQNTKGNPFSQKSPNSQNTKGNPFSQENPNSQNKTVNQEPQVPATLPAQELASSIPQTGIERPRHIDQYMHLLPAKTQERAAMVKGLLRQMDIARENARLLMNDDKSSPADRAKWASLATECDNEVRSIYKELDDEWEKLVKRGGVTVDDLGNARVLAEQPAQESIQNEETSLNSEITESQNTEENNAESAPAKNQNKRRQLRKWLVDTRRGNGDTRKEHVKKWKETLKEYISIEGDAAYKDDKILAAAEHYGIKIKKPNSRNQKLKNS